MIYNTGGIVLHRFNYTDSKVIVKIFTEEFGLQSYLFFGANSKAGRVQINLLQPFFPVNLQVYHKDTVDLQKAKHANLMFPLNSISTDFNKSAVCQFLSEFIYKILKENEKDEDLYLFLINSIKIFDNSSLNAKNFHLIFLYKLTKYLGIRPENNYSDTKRIFDMQSARFIIGRPAHQNYLKEELSFLISKLDNTPMEDSSNIEIANSDRKILIEELITFYNIHLDRPGRLKSLKVLREVFS